MYLITFKNVSYLQIYSVYLLDQRMQTVLKLES